MQACLTAFLILVAALVFITQEITINRERHHAVFWCCKSPNKTNILGESTCADRGGDDF